MALAGIILAAGKGTRMKSDLPKVLHLCNGLPMAELVGRALRTSGVTDCVVIVGHGAEQVKQILGDKNYRFAEQKEQLGTGHAALMAHDALKDFHGDVIVTAGDTPLLTGEALKSLVEAHQDAHATCTVASFFAANPQGYGRIRRDDDGKPTHIVEEKDATPEEKTIQEVNSGVYCFDAQALFDILPTLNNQNSQGEYYLPDALAAFARNGKTTHAVVLEEELFMGVNDRWQLAEASRLLNQSILRTHAENGVTIVDPSSTWISPEVEIGQDTVIEPMTSITGTTRIGPRCHIGPSTKIDDSQIGEGAKVYMSYVHGATVHDGSRCGPYAHLRPSAVIGAGAKVGNFVEIKNATLGDGASANHLTYIGDADVGKDSNVGAGTITCNYDGYRKSRTKIGNNSFVGSNSTLVAPVTIGDGAFVAAGSVITHDVGDDALAIGRARQEEKEGWAKRWREKNS